VDARPSFRERDCDSLPFVPGWWRFHRRPLWSPTRVIPLRRRSDGRKNGVSPHLNSIRLLTNHTSALTMCGVPGPRALGKEPALILTLVRLSISLRTPRYPSLTAPAHPRSAPLTYSTMTSGPIGTCYIDISPVGQHKEKRTSDVTGIHIFYGVKTIGSKATSLD